MRFHSEEAIVMANLRKRVAACDLERKRPTTSESETNVNETNQEQQLDNRPLLPKVSTRNSRSAIRKCCCNQLHGNQLT